MLSFSVKGFFANCREKERKIERKAENLTESRRQPHFQNIYIHTTLHTYIYNIYISTVFPFCSTIYKCVISSTLFFHFGKQPRICAGVQQIGLSQLNRYGAEKSFPIMCKLLVRLCGRDLLLDAAPPLHYRLRYNEN